MIGVLPHYAAAFAGIFYLRFLQNLSRLASWRKPFGPILAVLIPALLLFSGRDSLSTTLAGRSAHFGEARASMNRQLSQLPGKQLVLVRYVDSNVAKPPIHNPQEEWVFNAADIDASKVVWAREMGPEQDRPFLEYFHDRHAWLAEPDRSPPSLTPYPASKPAKGAPAPSFSSNKQPARSVLRAVTQKNGDCIPCP